MRVATFNIYWLGGNKIQRTDADEQHIATIIENLDADVIAFQEIIDRQVLKRILDLASSHTDRDYRIRDELGDWLESGSSNMRVMMAYDHSTTKLHSFTAISGGKKRKPCAIQVSDRQSGVEVTAVGVHLHSGYPKFDDIEDAAIRQSQCENINRWIHGQEAGTNPEFPEPATDHVLLLGDFNALNDVDVSAASFYIERPDVSYESLAALRTGDMEAWHWPTPLPDKAGGQFSVYEERIMIDFIMSSPSIASLISKPPLLYAFDTDKSFGTPGKHLSDHRPVVVEVNT